MGQKGKKYLWLKILIALVMLLVAIWVGFYYLLQSPRFLDFVVRQLNRSIAGQISYEIFEFDPDQRYLKIRGLKYQNDEGEKIVSIDSLDLNFLLGSALKGQLAIRHLRVQGVKIDQAKEKEKITPSTWRTALRILFKRLSMEDSIVNDFSVRLQNGDEFIFKEIRLSLSPQKNEGQTCEVWVSESLLKPADIEIKSGPLTFHGDIKIPLLTDYTFFVSDAKGNLSLEDVVVGDLPPATFKSDFEIGGEVLYLSNGRFYHPEGTLSVDIDYIPKKSTYKVDLKTMAPIPFQAIPKVSEDLLETFEKFEFSLRSEVKGFKLDQLTGKVELEVKTLGNKANPQTAEQHLSLKGDMKQGALTLKKFEITNAKTKLTASGIVDFAKQLFNVKINVTQFDLATLMEAVSEVDLGGYVDTEGTIQGPFKSPDFSFQAHGRELTYSFLHFGENKGIFKIQNGNLSYEGSPPAAMGYSASVQVRSDNVFKRERKTVLKTQFKGISAATLLDDPDITGKISGSFDLEDVGEPPSTGILKAQIEDFVVYGFHLGNVESEGKLGQNKFIISQLKFQPPDFAPMTVPKEVVFDFDKKGVKLQGEVLPRVLVKGHYEYEGQKKFFVDVTADNVDLQPILAALRLPPQESYADGTVKMALGVQGTPTTIDLNFSRLLIPLEEVSLRNDGPIQVEIRAPKVNFKQVQFASDSRSFAIRGTYTLDGPMDLTLDGHLNLELLKFFPEYFRNGEGFAKLNVKMGGTLEKPRGQGEITFENAALTLRPIRGQIEELNGTVKLAGNTLVFERLRGLMREGDLAITGRVDLEELRPKAYDVEIVAREVTIAEPGVYKIIFSGDFTLKGPADKTVLSGKMDITEGAYTRDFGITQFFLKPQEAALPEQPSPLLQNIVLNLNVRSPGELAIKNNVATMYFNADVKLTGPAAHPNVSGALEVLNGSFHYFNIDFGGARGTIDFRDPKQGPYVNVTAEKAYESAFRATLVTVQIVGFTKNLQLNFTSDPPLSRRDILGLVLTGVLPGDARVSGGSLASSVIASQLSQLIQRPLARSAHLDIFRLEASDSRSSQALSTLVVGKKLTDRITLEFKTDLGVDEPRQGIQMEYLLLDNLLLKGSQLTDGEFEFFLTWRYIVN